MKIINLILKSHPKVLNGCVLAASSVCVCVYKICSFVFYLFEKGFEFGLGLVCTKHVRVCLYSPSESVKTHTDKHKSDIWIMCSHAVCVCVCARACLCFWPLKCICVCVLIRINCLFILRTLNLSLSHSLSSFFSLSHTFRQLTYSHRFVCRVWYVCKECLKVFCVSQLGSFKVDSLWGGCDYLAS